MRNLEDLLYAIGMESQTADNNMPYLCALVGVQVPPRSLLEQQADEYQRDQIASANSRQIPSQRGVAA